MIMMMDSPNKNLGNWFTPKEIITPNKDSPVVTHTLFTHLTNLQGLLLDWQRIKDKGSKLCKTVSALKLHECLDDYYPSALKELTEGLLSCTDSFENIVQGVAVINQQLMAIAKLQASGDPIVNTWTAEQISSQVDKIYCTLQKECRLKLSVRENIAHCRDESLIEVYVSSWEFDVYAGSSLSAYLFADVGLAVKV